MATNDIITIRFEEGAKAPFVTPVDIAEISDGLITAFRVAGLAVGIEVEFSFYAPPRQGSLEFRFEAHYRSSRAAPRRQARKPREVPSVQRLVKISLPDAADLAVIASSVWLMVFGNRTVVDAIELFDRSEPPAEARAAVTHINEQENVLRRHVDTAVKELKTNAQSMQPATISVIIPDVGHFVLYRPPAGLDRLRYQPDWTPRPGPRQVMTIRRRDGPPFSIRYKGEEREAFYAISDNMQLVIVIWAKSGDLPQVSEERSNGEFTGELLVRAPIVDYRDVELIDPNQELLPAVGIYLVTRAVAFE